MEKQVYYVIHTGDSSILPDKTGRISWTGNGKSFNLPVTKKQTKH